MPVHIALLRAVNVGGTGALPMAELKAICEEIGFSDVATYIQSGNVVFRSGDSADAAGHLLDAALEKRLGKRPGVMIRSAAEMAGIAGKAPFPDAKPSHVLIHFLSTAAPPDALAGMVAPDGEEAVVSGREIYVHYPNGSGRSRLKLAAIKAGTSRNLNTAAKLAAMAAELQAKAKS